jgi:sugar phosphate isomerase/epimerase
VKFGLDVYSLRSQGWTPMEALEYCARLGAEVVHFSEIRLIGGLDPDHLRRMRARAAELGLELELGMRSISTGSTIFDPTAGTPEEQLVRTLEAAAIVGSPIVRCLVGRFVDRTGPGGIEARIAETLQVLRSVRSRARDMGLKIAVENHAGDMQARELRALVEEAGPDVVGVCIDSGNALWAMEDPRLTLETLAPYVLTSHVRDGAVWNGPQGIAVAWTRMGQGNIGIAEYIRQYIDSCPGRPLSLEVIVSEEPRILAYRNPEFWSAYGGMPAREFARFLVMAEQGSPVPRRPAADAQSLAARELEDVESSVQWTRNLLQTL